MHLKIPIADKHNLLPRFPHSLKLPRDPDSCTTCLSALSLKVVDFSAPVKIMRLAFGVYGMQADHLGKVVVGGLELEVRDLDAALTTEFPVHIQVLSRSANGKRVTELDVNPGQKGNVDVLRIPGFGRYSTIVINEVMKQIESRRPHLVHIHRPQQASTRIIIKRLKALGIPYVLTNHTWAQSASQIKARVFPKVSVAFSGLVRLIKRDGFFKAVTAAAVEVKIRFLIRFTKLRPFTANISKQFRGSSLTAVSAEAAKIFGDQPAVIIESPIDVDFFRRDRVTEECQSEFRKRFNLPNKKIIAYHARIEPGKGQHQLVDVAERLRTLYGDNFHFVIAGTNQLPSYLEGIKIRLREKNLQSHFTIVDALSLKDVRTLLSISSALTFPTQYEALGRTGVEAQLMGVPVVAHEVGGIPSYIKHNITGFLVKRDDAASMAEYLHICLATPHIIYPIIRHAELAARRKFSQTDIAHKYFSLVYGPLIANTYSDTPVAK